jgi:hypothetical protein
LLAGLTAFPNPALPHLGGDVMTLKLEPMRIDEHNWYYEEDKGICCVHEVLDKMGYNQKIDMWYIPWKKVLESVRRKYKVPIK